MIILAILILLIAVVGVFNLLQRLFAIYQESKRPAHQDAGQYNLKQGRELRPERHEKPE